MICTCISAVFLGSCVLQPLTWTNRGGSPADRYDRPGVEPKENAIGTYVGLDVSLKETSVCIPQDDGSVVFEGRLPQIPPSLPDCSGCGRRT
jgi:hypothetical protein